MFTWPWLVTAIVAVIGLFLSFKTYRRRYAEDVKASVFPSLKPYKIAWTIKSRDDPAQTLYVITEWECMLINTGDRAVNITGWGVMEPVRNTVVEVPNIYKIKNAVSETISGEIVQVYKNVYIVEPDETIPWPLDVPAGASKTFKLKIGLPIQRICQELVQAELNDNRMGDDTQEVFRFLRSKGLSIYGTTVMDRLIPVYFQSATGRRFVDAAFFNKAQP